jgi:hypothetical protein
MPRTISEWTVFLLKYSIGAMVFNTFALGIVCMAVWIAGVEVTADSPVQVAQQMGVKAKR